MRNASVCDFGDELDRLVDKCRDVVLDDRMTMAEVVGTLMFKAHTMMEEAMEKDDE